MSKQTIADPAFTAPGLSLRPDDVTSAKLDDGEVLAYWERLGREHMVKLGRRDLPYGRPLRLTRAAAAQLAAGASLATSLLERDIRSQGLTSYLKGHLATFCGVPLNEEGVNRRLEDRLKAGFRLPMMYDCMVAQQDDGSIGFQLVELQTALGYEVWWRHMIATVGSDPASAAGWIGAQDPWEGLKILKPELAGGRNITVIDGDPYMLPVEEVALARLFGEPHDLPIRALDIEWDGERYFYHRYKRNPETGLPYMDKGVPVKTEERVPITDYLTFVIQPDLDELEEQLRDNPQKRDTLLRFFRDGSRVNPVWHPTWSLIGDKSSLVELRRQLVADGNPYASHYVEVHRSGEHAGPGRWMKKPANGVWGQNQAQVVVGTGERIQVEDGCVYQRMIKPHAIPIPVSPRVATMFGDPSAVSPNPILRGLLEVRFSAPPYGRGEQLSGRFAGRMAPFYVRNTHEHPKTNMALVLEAVYGYLEASDAYRQDPSLHRLSPYGWCAMTIGR